MSVTEVRHPLVQHKLSYLRDKDTPTVHFRKLVEEVTLLLTYEATKDLPTEDVEIETPLERAPFPRISGKKVAVCPILRAGLGMLDGVLTLISGARVGFIGLDRHEVTCRHGLATTDRPPAGALRRRRRPRDRAPAHTGGGAERALSAPDRPPAGGRAEPVVDPAPRRSRALPRHPRSLARLPPTRGG